MKTITISITVPDGVEVQVDGASTSSFTPRPDPPEPDSPCPVHDAPWRMIPAGVSGPNSKNPGKPFNAFWVCSVKGCTARPGDSLVDPLPF